MTIATITEIHERSSPRSMRYAPTAYTRKTNAITSKTLGARIGGLADFQWAIDPVER